MDLPCPAKRLQSDLLVSQLLSWETSRLAIDSQAELKGEISSMCVHERQWKGKLAVNWQLNQIYLRLFAVPFLHLRMSQNISELYFLMGILHSS